MALPVVATIPVEDGHEVQALVSLVRQPDGQYSATYHPAVPDSTLTQRQAAALLRWLADAMDIDGLPEVPHGVA